VLKVAMDGHIGITNQ